MSNKELQTNDLNEVVGGTYNALTQPTKLKVIYLCKLKFNQVKNQYPESEYTALRQQIYNQVFASLTPAEKESLSEIEYSEVIYFPN